MNGRMEELLESDSGLPDILKSYGSEAIIKFVTGYFVGFPPNVINSFTQRTLSCAAGKTEPDEPDWPEFSSSVFYYMIEKNENVHYFPSEVEEKEMYGLLPPPELLCGIKNKARYKNFWRSFRIGDVILCQVHGHVPQDKEYLVRIISFAEKKYRYMEDFQIIIRMKEQDVPREIDLKIGDYIQGVFYDCIPEQRKIFLSLKPEHLSRRTTTTLGVVTEKDFPLHYKFTKERPFNSMEAYMGLSDKKYPYQLRNLCTESFHLDEKKFYSIDLDMENYDVPNTEKVNYVCLDHTESMASSWFHRARAYYGDGELEKSLEAFANGFKYDPYNANSLVNRAAVYGNTHNFAKARSDLEFCLKIDSDNSRAIEYLEQICRTQFALYGEKGNYLGVANTVCRLLFMPMNNNDPSLNSKLTETTVEFDFNDVFSTLLDVEESDHAPDTTTVDGSEDDESLTSLLKKKHELESQVTNPFVVEESQSQPPMSDVTEDDVIISKEERRPHKKHKKHSSQRMAHRKYRKENRRYREHSRSPTRKRSRTPPSPRHRRSPHRSRRSPSISPTRTTRTRRSRSITPRRRRFSKSPSGHRGRKSRSASPKRRRSPTSPYHYRRSPRRRRSSSSS